MELRHYAGQPVGTQHLRGFHTDTAGPTIDADHKAAAVKWIDFFYMGKLTNEEASVADAEALAATDAPIGTPALPIFSAEQLAQSDAWVAEFVNVPLEQMASFKDNIIDQPLIPEPPANTQEMYAILDTVVQTVLTEEDADIATLLAQADADVTALVEAAG